MNAFHYKGQPSRLAKELNRTETAKRNAAGRLVRPTDNRVFHVYSKAVPNEQPRKD